MIFFHAHLNQAETPTTKPISQLGASSTIASILLFQSLVRAIFFPGFIKELEPEWYFFSGYTAQVAGIVTGTFFAGRYYRPALTSLCQYFYRNIVIGNA